MKSKIFVLVAILCTLEFSLLPSFCGANEIKINSSKVNLDMPIELTYIEVQEAIGGFNKTVYTIGFLSLLAGGGLTLLGLGTALAIPIISPEKGTGMAAGATVGAFLGGVGITLIGSGIFTMVLGCYMLDDEIEVRPDDDPDDPRVFWVPNSNYTDAYTYDSLDSSLSLSY